MRIHITVITMVATACLLAALPARADLRLEPGLWQQTESGTENGAPVKPEITTRCMTAAEVRGPTRALSAFREMGGLVGRSCKTVRVRENDNTMSVDFDCGEPRTLQVAINMSFKFLDAGHYAGTVKSSFMFDGRKNSTEKTIDAKRISAVCKPR